MFRPAKWLGVSPRSGLTTGLPRPESRQHEAICLLDADLAAAARPSSFNGGGQSAAGSEFAAHSAPDGLGCGDDVSQNAVDGVFVEDAEIAIGQEVEFQRLQLKALTPGFVFDGDGSVIGQAMETLLVD